MTAATLLAVLEPFVELARTVDRAAEEEGFEPPVPCSTAVFKTAAFDHSATPPARSRAFVGSSDFKERTAEVTQERPKIKPPHDVPEQLLQSVSPGQVGTTAEPKGIVKVGRAMGGHTRFTSVARRSRIKAAHENSLGIVNPFV